MSKHPNPDESRTCHKCIITGMCLHFGPVYTFVEIDGAPVKIVRLMIMQEVERIRNANATDSCRALPVRHGRAR